MAKRQTHIRERYWRALGKFVDDFAAVEMAMVLLLMIRTNTPLDVGRAIFSGVRIKEAMALIGRVGEVRPLDDETKADQEYVFAQLRVIIEFRNDILHYGSQTITPTEFEVSNWLIALDESRLRKQRISAKTLLQLVHDLRKIELHLQSRHILRDAVTRSEQRVLRSSWRYIPPEQAPRRRKTRGNVPARQRQRAS
ncbi:MAG: hypothetical protein WD852_07405 [Methyloceanibacter sp.]